MGAGEVCRIFLLKNPKCYNDYFMATVKWATCLSLSIKFLMDTCPHMKKPQLALIGMLACSFCGEFSNGHGSRTPSISPQETSFLSRLKSSWCWHQEALLPLRWPCAWPWLLSLALGSHGEWNKPTYAVGCLQVGVSSWPQSVRDIWTQCWAQHAALRQPTAGEKRFFPEIGRWKAEQESKERNQKDCVASNHTMFI